MFLRGIFWVCIIFRVKVRWGRYWFFCKLVMFFCFYFYFGLDVNMISWEIELLWEKFFFIGGIFKTGFNKWSYFFFI